MAYDPATIEPRWQAYWDAQRTFRTEDGGDRPKYYVLDMFPYPSGQGLHVGHPEGYTATDIMARYKRMRGYNVLHPMGWDAFGLPAENYAVKTGTHPAVTTRKNIETFKRQLKMFGFSYDWDREIATTHPGYYRWTQWIFTLLYKEGLAYEAEVPVNWCPELGTVLANEEVVDGRSEVGGHPVIRKPMKQWMLRITAYAERLLADLDDLDWPEGIKELQRNWIGRSEGAEVDFAVPALGFFSFFRNRAQLYGFFSDSGTPTDSMNLIGNEMTNMGFLMGNFIVNGAGHLNHGNNVRGTTTPANTQNIGIETLLYPDGNLPAFMEGTLPYIGYPLAMDENTTPAHARYVSGTNVSCVPPLPTALDRPAPSEPRPMLHGNVLIVPESLLPARLMVVGMDGRIHLTASVTTARTALAVPASPGIHVVSLLDASGRETSWKTVVE